MSLNLMELCEVLSTHARVSGNNVYWYVDVSTIISLSSTFINFMRNICLKVHFEACNLYFSKLLIMIGL
jgi:hypothetical protein